MKTAVKPLPDLKPLPLDDRTPLDVRPVPVPVCELLSVDEEVTTVGDWSSVDALMPTRPDTPALKCTKT